jgi:acyl-CoA reductase-like NAD-dependent aldehyde dehydrogenase
MSRATFSRINAAVAVRKVSEQLKNNWQELAKIESAETGKPLSQAADEIRWAGDIWDFAAGQTRPEYSRFGKVSGNTETPGTA